MKAAELKFRHILGNSMKGQWMMSWHEDREISPGIPDLHYVVGDSDDNLYRVGWLELKAVDSELSSKVKLKVEPSQHRYMEKWRSCMPIHFLILVVDVVYLIDGIWHAAIPTMTSIDRLQEISIEWFYAEDIATTLPKILKRVTRVQHYGGL